MKLTSLFAILVFAAASTAHAAAKYSVELAFEFSSSTSGFKNYRGNIVGHEAVFEDLKAQTIEGAIKEASALVGTKYDKSVSVFTCNAEPGNTAASIKCRKRVTDALIVGADVNEKEPESSHKALCKVGDSLTSGMKSCSPAAGSRGARLCCCNTDLNVRTSAGAAGCYFNFAPTEVEAREGCKNGGPMWATTEDKVCDQHALRFQNEPAMESIRRRSKGGH